MTGKRCAPVAGGRSFLSSPRRPCRRAGVGVGGVQRRQAALSVLHGPRRRCPARSEHGQANLEDDVSMSRSPGRRRSPASNGVVVLWMNFGHTGNSYGEGNSLVTFEAFKVWGGEIHAVNAFFKGLPVGTSRFWSTSDPMSR